MFASLALDLAKAQDSAPTTASLASTHHPQAHGHVAQHHASSVFTFGAPSNATAAASNSDHKPPPAMQSLIDVTLAKSNSKSRLVDEGSRVAAASTAAAEAAFTVAGNPPPAQITDREGGFDLLKVARALKEKEDTKLVDEDAREERAVEADEETAAERAEEEAAAEAAAANPPVSNVRCFCTYEHVTGVRTVCVMDCEGVVVPLSASDAINRRPEERRRIARARDEQRAKAREKRARIIRKRTMRRWTEENDEIADSLTRSERQRLDDSDYVSASDDERASEAAHAAADAAQQAKDDDAVPPFYLCTAATDSKIRIFNPYTRRCVRTLEGHTHYVRSLVSFVVRSALPDHAQRKSQVLLASASTDSTIRIWEPVCGESVRVLRGHRGAVRSLCLLRGMSSCSYGVALASGGVDRKIIVWDIQSGQPVRTMKRHNATVTAVAQIPNPHWTQADAVVGDSRDGSSDGSSQDDANAQRPHRFLLVSASADSTICLWSLNSLQCLREFSLQTAPAVSRHHNWIYALAPIVVRLTPQQQRNGERSHERMVLLASCSADRTIRIWDVESGRCVHTLRGHADTVTDLLPISYASDERRRDDVLLASSSWDGSVRIWSVESGECLASLSGHAGFVWKLARVPKVFATHSMEQGEADSAENIYLASVSEDSWTAMQIWQL
jgi:WD40 repeat protein